MPPRKKAKRQQKQKAYPGVTSAQVNQLQEAFQLFDTTRTGEIEKRELPFAMSAAGWKPEKKKIREIMETVETENDRVAFAIYVELMTPTMKEQDENDTHRVAFSMYDIDNKGYIDVEDLERVSKDLGENDVDIAECNEMIKEAGKDGKVTYEEFYKIMQFTEDTKGF